MLQLPVEVKVLIPSRCPDALHRPATFYRRRDQLEAWVRDPPLVRRLLLSLRFDSSFFVSLVLVYVSCRKLRDWLAQQRGIATPRPLVIDSLANKDH